LFFVVRRLTRHCQLESDQEELLSPVSDLFEFRTRVRDLIKEVVFMVGVSEFVRENQLFEQLQLQLQQLRNGHADRGWEAVEAQLFILSCVTKELSEQQDLLNQLLTLLLTTHDTRLHVQILATNCVILGELGEWLEKNTAFLQPVLNYLLAMITAQPAAPRPPPSSSDCDSEDSITLASIAANSLQQIVGSTSRLNVLADGDLINVLIDISAQLDHVLDETAAYNLLQCCATMITNAGSQQNENNQVQNQQSVGTFEHQQKLVVRLLQPSVDALEALLNGQNSSRNPVVYLDRIKAVLRSLHFKETMARNSVLNDLIENRLWPLLERLLTQLITTNNSKTVEKGCKCMRCIIRCLRPVWLLKPIATTIVNLYQANPTQSPYLYLASVLVDQFADDCDQTTIAGLVSMLNALSLPTFQLLTAPNTLLRDHPYTIDDFFRLCTRFVQKAPGHVLSEASFESILDLAVACLALEHRDANLSVTKFVIEMFVKGSEKGGSSRNASSGMVDLTSPARAANSSSSADSVLELKRKALLHNQFGQRLLQAAIINALFRLSAYFIPEMSDLVWHVVSWDNKLAGEWLRTVLTQLPTHSTPGLPVLEPAQLDEFYNNVMQANGPKIVASSLRYLSRLLR
jgi:transportin-3